MDPIPRARVQELLSALRPAVPGLAVAVVALVLAVALLIVALFHHPLDLLASLAGPGIATPLSPPRGAVGFFEGSPCPLPSWPRRPPLRWSS
jgi:hypothetical protein